MMYLLNDYEDNYKTTFILKSEVSTTEDIENAIYKMKKELDCGYSQEDLYDYLPDDVECIEVDGVVVW